MKLLKLLAVNILAFALAFAAPAQTPAPSATPIPLATPAPASQPLNLSATLPTATVQAALAALAPFVALPSGVSAAQIHTIQILIQADGSAVVNVR